MACLSAAAIGCSAHFAPDLASSRAAGGDVASGPARFTPAADTILGAPTDVDREPIALTFRRGAFPDSLRVGDRSLLLNGTGVCEWGIFGIDLYEAALWVERRVSTSSEALASDQAMVLHLRFVRGLTAAQLGEAFAASVRANAGDRAPRHADSLRALQDAMADVARGDSYTFVCEPGKGLVIERDGRTVARIPDEGFRRLFVRLYLGDIPPTEALRDALLGS